MPLTPGTRLGSLEIGALIGVGGMGEVYRATDTNLKRPVAVKVLPHAVAGDPDRLARFQREAEVLAALNHPNVAQIYGLERSDPSTGPGQAGAFSLVMELVDGPTLADRILESAIPVEESLRIATQIIDALAAAHERGIIHRDLKPANIKLRPDGTVKVLDFGLAKLTDVSVAVRTTGVGDLSQSPTITTPAMTQLGVILGTAAYMSPEQAKGREADKRSDVWAFGAVLFEMLTGRRAFEGEDVSETLASVLKTEPDWTRLPADIPPAIGLLLKRCLVKDPRQRVSDMSVARFVMNESGGLADTRPSNAAASSNSAARSRRHSLMAAAAAAALTAIVAAAVAWALLPTRHTPQLVRFSITPEFAPTLTGTSFQVLAVSPDGTKLAWAANRRLYVRSIDELDARAVTDAVSTLSPVFAPDGRSILFVTISDGGLALQRIPLDGGVASTIATLEGFPSLSGISWSEDGILIGAPGARGGILRVRPSGGALERLIPVGANEILHGPQMLPGGRELLFTVADSAREDLWDHAKVVTQSLTDNSRRVLVENASDGRYVPSGHLLYTVGGTVYAVPFDVKTLTVTGIAVPVISGVRRATGAQTGATQMAVSPNGTLAYVPGPATSGLTMRNLVIGDGRGDAVPLKVPPAFYVHPRVSPDGRTLAVGRSEGQTSDIWTYDLAATNEIKRLTFGGASRFPVWSADSRRVTFQSSRDGDRAIWWQPLAGGTAERLTTPAKDEEHVPESWAKDGTRLLFSVHKSSSFSLWVLTLNGKKTEPFGNVTSQETPSASFSPDGRWVTYASTERAGGTLSANRGVFVEPFPPTGEKHQAPKTLLDYHPVWAADGKSILYVPGSSRSIVSVPISTQPSVSFGTPVELPRAPMPGLISLDMRGYDMLPDGRLVGVSQLESAGSRTELRVVLNWFEELRRVAPIAR